MNNIYIYELGYRNPIADKDQIIWLWEQRAKTYSRQNHRTRYWLDLLEQYEKRLIALQAFELLLELRKHVTTEQLNRRFANRTLAKAKAQLEYDNLVEWQKNYKLKVELTTIKNLN